MSKSKLPPRTVGNFFSRITAFLYYIVKISPLGLFFTSYPVSRSRKKSRHGRHSKRYKMRRAAACAMERNILAKGFDRLFSGLCKTDLRTFGVCFLIYGLLSCCAYLISITVWPLTFISWRNLIAGASTLSVGFLCLCSDASLGCALRRGVFGRLLIEVFGISDDAIEAAPEHGRGAYFTAVLFGLACAGLSCIFPPIAILAVIAGIFAVCMVIATPESGVLLLLLLLPFVGYIPYGRLVLVGVALLLTASYGSKLLRGNRVFRIEAQDVPVALMALFFLISAFSVAGGHSWLNAVLNVVLVIAYFPLVNSIATDRWLNRCRIAMATAATIASCIGISQFISHLVALRGNDFTGTMPAMADLGRYVTAGFADETVLAYYLVLSFALIFPVLRETRGALRWIGNIACLLMAAATVLTWDMSAWLALALTLPVYALVLDRRSFPVLLFGAGALTGAWFLLPDKVTTGIRNFFPNPWAIATRGAESFVDLSRFFFNGSVGIVRFFIGLGNGGLAAFYPLIGEAGARFVASDHSCWFTLTAELGIIGATMPVFIFLLVLQHAFTVLVSLDPRAKPSAVYCGITVITAMIAFCFSSYTWYDASALTAFFAALAMLGAGLRIERDKAHLGHDVVEQGNFRAETDYRSRSGKKVRSKAKEERA